MIGTLVNSAAILAGSAIGLLIHRKLPEKPVGLMFQSIGLVTVVIGISMALRTENFLLLVVSLTAGSLLGNLIGIERGLEKLSGKFIKNAPGADGSNTTGNTENKTTQGFITATMLFGVGSMSILGAFEEGLGQAPTLLYTKSVMDGICSVVLASSFGISVAFSVIPVLLYQGSLTLLAGWLEKYMSAGMIDDLTAAGGVLLIGLSLNILKIKNVPVLDMLPALILVVILSGLL